MPFSGTVSISPTSAYGLFGGNPAVHRDGDGLDKYRRYLDGTDGRSPPQGSTRRLRSPLTPRATVTATSQANTAVSASATVTIDAATSGINPKNYGATGNGTTDDTAAINSAIAALTPGASLVFPCGTYLVSSQLSIKSPASPWMARVAPPSTAPAREPSW